MEIIGIECADDFKVHVTGKTGTLQLKIIYRLVNLGCLKQEYPTLDITDLVFSPPGESDDTAENTCGAFTQDATGNNYWYR